MQKFVILIDRGELPSRHTTEALNAKDAAFRVAKIIERAAGENSWPARLRSDLNHWNQIIVWATDKYDDPDFVLDWETFQREKRSPLRT